MFDPKKEKRTVENKAAVKNGISRLVFAGISIILQFWVIIAIGTRLYFNATIVQIAIQVIGLLLVLGIFSMYQSPSIKMPWIVLILTIPVAGIVFYLANGLSVSTRAVKRRYQEIDQKLYPRIVQDRKVHNRLETRKKSAGNLASYIEKYAPYPVYENTDVKFFGDTNEALASMKTDLRAAQSFIFMEYYAIEDAEVFHEIEEILVEKVGEGVEVRIFYDDIGSISFINKDFVHRMEEKGIACRVFNPFSSVINMFLNNRDHRKITVIDGKVGYTGGYNLANEYFNRTHPYGHWKDSGVRLEGDAVRSLTVMQLEMWNAIRDSDKDDEVFTKYFPKVDYKAKGEGFVQPYCDSPMDHENVGENVYLSLIYRAQDYIYFMTPYLIITDEMVQAFGLAAKRGVDVRIITPQIPDKKTVFSVTRSYYHNLVRNGVRIYEYTPGFCHAKQCVSDDFFATCGTINLDYRSLYHHFEDGVVLYGCDAVTDIRKDFEDTFPVCEEVTEKYATGRSVFLRFRQLVLRLFASLL